MVVPPAEVGPSDEAQIACVQPLSEAQNCWHRAANQRGPSNDRGYTSDAQRHRRLRRLEIGARVLLVLATDLDDLHVHPPLAEVHSAYGVEHEVLVDDSSPERRAAGRDSASARQPEVAASSWWPKSATVTNGVIKMVAMMASWGASSLSAANTMAEFRPSPRSSTMRLFFSARQIAQRSASSGR
mgnify:CR=1 FL=1